MKQTWIPIIDAGHSGIVNGEYKTPGKRAYFKDGIYLGQSDRHKRMADEWIYEGENNRKIRDLVSEMLIKESIQHYYVNDSENDMSNSKRAEHANEIAALNPERDFVFISIHSNAGGGYGNEVFTSKGETKSDKFAEIMCEEIEESFPEWKLRKDTVSDGDKDKEANFTVLVNTSMPAFLIEFGFMDTYSDFQIINSDAGRKQMAIAIVEAIKRFQNEIL